MVIKMQRTSAIILFFLQSCESVVFTVLCPADLYKCRPGTLRHRTVPGRASADVFLKIIQTPAGARTICDHARENS